MYDNNNMPRDDVERARNVRNALANASVSERKRRGNGFPPPIPLASTPPSTLENRPVCASPIHSAPLASLPLFSFSLLSLSSLSLPSLPPSCAPSLNVSPSGPFHLTFSPFPPAITINQNRSQYLILVEWCSVRSAGRSWRTSERLHVRW